MKRCSRCGSDKSLDEFGSHRGQPDGKALWCKDCAREYDQRYKARPGDRERRAEYARRRRQLPDVKARLRRTDAEWRAQHRDLRHQYDTSETKRARARAYIATPEARELRRVAEANRRAAKKADGGRVSMQDWLEVLEAFQRRCAYCLTGDVPLHMDHLEPLSKGGPHTKSNIVPACKECNMRKSTKSLLKFATVA